MSTKKNPFTSIRIISKKAQQMLAKARAGHANSVGDATIKQRRNAKESMQEVLLHLSLRSVINSALVIIGLLVGLWLIFQLRHKLILLFLAIFIATLIDPGVQALQRWRIPRGIAILIHYFVAVFVIGFLLVSFIPIIGDQIGQIATNLGHLRDQVIQGETIHIPLVPDRVLAPFMEIIQRVLSEDQSVNKLLNTMLDFSQELRQVAQGPALFIINIAGSIVSFFVSLIVVLVLAFFIQMDKEFIIRWAKSFLPAHARVYAANKSEAIHTKIGQWMRGELLLMFSIFSLTFIALTILGMDYALTLAVLAGFCELIPAVGPFFAAMPAILIAGTQNGIVWIPIIAFVYYMIQWCENNLLVPLIMKRAVGLSPVAILFAMMVGISFPDTLHPVLGVMLAVPTTTIITLFLEDWREKRVD